MPPLPALNVSPLGAASLVSVTVQLVAVPAPKAARLPSAQTTSPAPFHHELALLPQAPVPSCAPEVEVSPSQTSALPVANVVAQFVALAGEVPEKLVATTE